MAMVEQSNPCCYHMFAQPWALNAGGNQVTVVPRICCHHGELSVLYNGIAEEGHGSYAEFTEPNPAAALTLPPNGAKLLR